MNQTIIIEVPEPPKPYIENGTGKYICKRKAVYKETEWICTGSSRKSAKEAKQSWIDNYLKKVDEIDGRTNKKAGRIKLDVAMRAWYDTYMKRKRTHGRPRSQQTIATDQCQMKQILSVLGNELVCDLDTDTLQTYFKELADSGVKSDTLRKRWILLNQFCAKTFPGNNPMLGCERPDTDDMNIQYLIDEDEKEYKTVAYENSEMERLTEVLLSNPAGKNRIQAQERGKMLVVIMWQFLRLGEAVELRVKDIDFKNHTLHIRRQYDEVHKLVSFPKDNSKRDMPISDKCYMLLEEMCQGKDANDLIFRGKQDNLHGGRVLRKPLRNTLDAACEEAGIERHVIHDLRHDGISYYVRKGIKPQSIQKWAGHKSIMITLSVYYRQTKEDDAEDRALMCTD